MDYMNWYEICLNLARIKSNGGELSEVEKSELGSSVRNGNGNDGGVYVSNVGILPV